MKNKIKIALLDDHRIVLDGLKLLLSQNENLEIVHEETSGKIMLEELRKNPSVDVILTDISMPEMDGVEFSKIVSSEFPQIHIIALSLNSEGQIIHKLLAEADISGYLLKTTNKTELYQAIETVMTGKTYFSKEIADNLAQYRHNKQHAEALHLTQREIELIRQLAKGLSNKEIAQQLFISEKTVETHRKNIFRKTNVNNLVKLLELARVHQLI